jgi:hypothetical protein
MSKLTTELRAAAASARAFADNLDSPELKRNFKEMARGWEAEADKREKEDRSPRPGTSRRSQAFAKGPAGRRH